MKRIFKGFKAKMWMTAGLGLFFFGLYFIIVVASRLVIHQGNGLALMDAARRMPLVFINLGLLVFAACSLLIYLVRMVIKYLYLTRGRD